MKTLGPGRDDVNIRLRALDFYKVIIDKSKARINLIVFVGSAIKLKIFNKKDDFWVVSYKRNHQEDVCFAFRYLSRTRKRVE